MKYRLLAVLDALLFAAAVLSLTAAFLAPWLYGRHLYGAQKGPSPSSAASLPGQAAEAVQPPGPVPAGGRTVGRPLTVLLLGLDARPGEPSGRSDAIVVARYDPVKNGLRLLSVPRDTLAEVPSHGMDKINSACALGVPDDRVKWDPATQTVTVENNGTAVMLKVGDRTAILGNRAVTLDVPPQVVNGRTLVPLRFLGEAFGKQVEWYPEGNIVAVGEQ